MDHRDTYVSPRSALKNPVTSETADVPPFLLVQIIVSRAGCLVEGCQHPRHPLAPPLPNAGVLYDCMRHSRRAYHSTIRITGQIEKDIRKDKVAEHCQEKSAKNFWQCIKRINDSGECLPSKIDNEVDTRRIAGNFAEKYRLLYTKVPTDPLEIETLGKQLDSLCAKCNMRECRVTAVDVRKAISKLKSGKSDGIDGFMLNHIIHASDKFSVIVGMLINAMLTHGHNPGQLLNIVVKSIPKDMRGSLHSSNSYRGISLCNALCKLIDLIGIEKCDGYLYTSELQFAFKREHSTMLCTAVFKETVSHFLENGSNLYACLLDASSAFDRVHYGKLFDVLKELGTSRTHSAVIRCLTISPVISPVRPSFRLSDGREGQAIVSNL